MHILSATTSSASYPHGGENRRCFDANRDFTSIPVNEAAGSDKLRPFAGVASRRAQRVSYRRRPMAARAGLRRGKTRSLGGNRNRVLGERSNSVIVCASTECYPSLPLTEALSRLVDLEYSSVEIALHENLNQLKPSAVAANLEAAVAKCQETMRLDVVAYSVETDAQGEEFYRQFAACCKLAKATKVVTITVASGELGTPFNEEVERLRKLVDLASLEGVRVAMKSQVGRLSEDPDTVIVLCDNVRGLGITLDPTQYLCGSHGGKSIDRLMKYVYHVHLRDSTKDKPQVRVGQGEIEYGRLINQLRMVDYNRALSVHITEMEGVEHMAEMRKMRLLLESLLI
jgi:sugar phosphate isomerase/epimerase